MIVLINPVLQLWFVVMIVLFWRLPHHRALILGVIFGCLFLPEMHLAAINENAPQAVVFLVLKLSKQNVVNFAALFAAVLFDSKRLLAFRPRWFDLPMAVYCCCSFIGNYLNGVSPYDSFAAMRDLVWVWGTPYFLGRVYLSDADKFRELMIGIILGGLVYVPICLIETKNFPSFHQSLYGFFPGDPGEAVRPASVGMLVIGLILILLVPFTRPPAARAATVAITVGAIYVVMSVISAFRPVAFMQHGLALGMWMVVTAIVSFWLFYTGALPEVPWWPGKKPLPMHWVMATLLATALLMKSGGAISLGLVAVLGLFQVRYFKWPVILIFLLILSPAYIVGRVWAVYEKPAGWLNVDMSEQNYDGINKFEKNVALKQKMFGWSQMTGQDFVDGLKAMSNEGRAASYQFRMKFEGILMEKGSQRPWFGWGDTGLGRVRNKKGGDVTASDGLWIINLVAYGFVGISALWMAMLLPAVRFMWTYPTKQWFQPTLAPMAAASVVLIVYMIDNISNAMINPIYTLMAGGLSGVIGTLTTKPSREPLETYRQQVQTMRRPEPLARDLQDPGPAVKPPPGVLTRRRPFIK